MKMNDKVREELDSFMIMHGTSVLYLFGSVLITSSEYRGWWLVANALVIFLTSLLWFVFRTSKTLDVRYLLFQSVICCFTMVLMALALADIWLTGGSSGWLLLLILLLSSLGPVIGILARIYEPTANFEMCLKRGRFILKTCEFDPSVPYGVPTRDNPVLRAAGMNSGVDCNGFSSFARKVPVYSALGFLFFGSLRSVGNPGFFESLLLALGIFCVGYLYFYIYVADLCFCVKASRAE